MSCSQLVRCFSAAALLAAGFDSAEAWAADAPGPATEVAQRGLGASSDYDWRRGDGVLLPNPGVAIAQPRTRGMPTTVARTSAQLQLSAGTALFTCPDQTPECQLEPGIAAELAVLLRPVPWFSWGGALGAQQFSRTWNFPERMWVMEQRVLSGKLLARVHVPDLGVVDPYVAVSLGGAAIYDSVSESQAPKTTSWLGSPAYGARAGLNIRVSDRVELGALVDWTNIQQNTGEHCPWVVGGVCSSNSWTAFSPSNALWNAAATVSFAFGEEL